jgi:hypothetical protein
LLEKSFTLFDVLNISCKAEITDFCSSFDNVGYIGTLKTREALHYAANPHLYNPNISLHCMNGPWMVILTKISFDFNQEIICPFQDGGDI